MWKFPDLQYFSCIAAFEVLYRWTSIKGGSHMSFVDLLDIHASTKRIWTLPSEVQWYGASNAAMRLNYAMEWPSIFTRDCHI